ncbi:methionine--tRNA ligase [Candidatus Sneabacter namystus]|uniref:Methionine--tRNA ligase n=1 Tax=Candidatus Sneabacter namystus TaxID=2601646 RepID=A0A5C0UJ32_9RICK|nr:methionine--tRNA ligase [Candidatus Sneabacter namystus]QEK39797.1 methionine--tRNA ligase [Candidatus Sneabacter namystus]
MSHSYVTTPIFYVNDKPHLGHSYTCVIADVIARQHRLFGKQVILLTGTDEHGIKIERAAKSHNTSPQNFVDVISMKFKNLMTICNISNNDFIRTTETRHKEAVHSLWNTLSRNGYIYLGKYSGWYSIRDEAFYNESDLTEDKLAPTGSTVEWVEEESYFFALSKLQNRLISFYENNPLFIYPNTKRTEVINFIKQGLQDISISRTSVSWGISVPNNPKHVIYVWLDALTNYITALGYPNVDDKKFKNFWTSAIHIIGKDILKFHAVYWPAFLMAAELSLPQKLVVHGWWTIEGEKMSKSVGNVIDPIQLQQEASVDAMRYFLLKEIPLGKDGNFSKTAFVNRVNSELADKIGNLVQRVTAFSGKYFNHAVPDIKDASVWKIHPLSVTSTHAYEAIKKININFDIKSALSAILQLASDTNKHIDTTTPWTTIKTNKEQASIDMYIALTSIKHIGIYLQPFMPDAAKKILSIFALNMTPCPIQHLAIPLLPKAILQPCQILFTKIEK